MSAPGSRTVDARPARNCRSNGHVVRPTGPLSQGSAGGCVPINRGRGPLSSDNDRPCATTALGERVTHAVLIFRLPEKYPLLLRNATIITATTSVYVLVTVCRGTGVPSRATRVRPRPRRRAGGPSGTQYGGVLGSVRPVYSKLNTSLRLGASEICGGAQVRTRPSGLVPFCSPHSGITFVVLSPNYDAENY